MEDTQGALMSHDTHIKINEYLKSIKTNETVFDETLFYKYIENMLIKDGVEKYAIRINNIQGHITVVVYIAYLKSEYHYEIKPKIKNVKKSV